MSSSFISKIKYKKERVGVVRKDGKAYVKYMKARRFRMSKSVEYSLLTAFILIFLAVVVKLLLSELASRPLAEGAADGIGG